ncbi:MAG TPA: response regulator transcription factor [Bacteroidales bacterium]|nr:response regulator transcription factor [Bacteroidales bacterium]
MAKTLVIAEQSEIIRKGLVQIAESSGYFDTVIEVACASNLDSTIARYSPEVLLINPSFSPNDCSKYLQPPDVRTLKLGAIIYTLFEDEVISRFDELILITDTCNKIRKKLNNLISKTTITKAPGSGQSLSSRELEVLKLLVKGLINKEISDKLHISTHTVVTHRKNITKKLSIKSVAGLTIYAILNNLIAIDDVK